MVTRWGEIYGNSSESEYKRLHRDPMKRISLSQVKLKQTLHTAKNAGALANEAK